MDATIRGQAESISKSLFKYLELFLTHDFPNRTTGICGGHLRHLVALQMRLDCCQNNHKRRRWPIISRLDTLLHFSHCQRQGALGTGQVVSRRPFCWHQKRCEELSRRRRCSGGRTKSDRVSTCTLGRIRMDLHLDIYLYFYIITFQTAYACGNTAYE